MLTNRLIRLFFLAQCVYFFSSAGAVSPTPTPASSCEKDLENISKKDPQPAAAELAVRVLREWVSRGQGWMGWQVMDNGRVFLASIGPADTLSVYEPWQSDQPVVSVNSVPGASLTRAAWMSGARLVVGDDLGHLVRASVLRRSSQRPQFQGSPVEVWPDVDADDTIVAGLGDMARVRIMPAGTGHHHDIPLQSSVGHAVPFRAKSGRHLLAVANAGTLQVFDTEGSSERPIFSMPVNSRIEPQWLLDEAGQCAVAFIDSGTLMVVYPEAANRYFLRTVPGDARLSALRSAEGASYLLVSGRRRKAELLNLRSGGLILKNTFETDGGDLRLVETAPGALYVAYTSGEAHWRQFHIAGIASRSRVFSMPLAADEQLRNVATARTHSERGLMAIGTSRALYVLDWTQAPLR